MDPPKQADGAEHAIEQASPPSSSEANDEKGWTSPPRRKSGLAARLLAQASRVDDFCGPNGDAFLTTVGETTPLPPPPLAPPPKHPELLEMKSAESTYSTRSMPVRGTRHRAPAQSMQQFGSQEKSTLTARRAQSNPPPEVGRNEIENTPSYHIQRGKHFMVKKKIEGKWQMKEHSNRGKAKKMFGALPEQAWRTIVFIRHAESKWNESKGKGGLKKIAAVWKGYTEKMAYTRAKKDAKNWGGNQQTFDDIGAQSDILDSPLSDTGIRQCNELRKFLLEYRQQDKIELYRELRRKLQTDMEVARELLREAVAENHDEKVGECARIKDSIQKLNISLGGIDEFVRNYEYKRPLDDRGGIHMDDAIDLQEIVHALNGKEDTAVVCSSNLRRAISTAFLALHQRFRANPTEKIIVHSCLQEMGANADTHSCTQKGKVPICHEQEKDNALVQDLNSVPGFQDRAGKAGLDIASLYKFRLDAMYNHGNKDGTYSRKERMWDFVRFCFEDNQKPYVIAVGHSKWILTFFQQYLPKDIQGVQPMAMEYKIDNCSVIACRVMRTPTSERKDKHGAGDYVVSAKSIKLVHGRYKPKKFKKG